MKKTILYYLNALKDKNHPPKTEPSMINHRNSILNFTKFRFRFNYFSLNLEQILIFT